MATNKAPPEPPGLCHSYSVNNIQDSPLNLNARRATIGRLSRFLSFFDLQVGEASASGNLHRHTFSQTSTSLPDLEQLRESIQSGQVVDGDASQRTVPDSADQAKMVLRAWFRNLTQRIFHREDEADQVDDLFEEGPSNTTRIADGTSLEGSANFSRIAGDASHEGPSGVTLLYDGGASQEGPADNSQANVARTSKSKGMHKRPVSTVSKRKSIPGRSKDRAANRYKDKFKDKFMNSIALNKFRDSAKTKLKNKTKSKKPATPFSESGIEVEPAHVPEGTAAETTVTDLPENFGAIARPAYVPDDSITAFTDMSRYPAAPPGRGNKDPFSKHGYYNPLRMNPVGSDGPVFAKSDVPLEPTPGYRKAADAMKVQVETNPKLRATIEKNVAARQQKTEAGDDDNTVRMMKAAMAKPPTIFRPRDGMAGPSLETSDTVAPAASQHEVESKSDAIDAPSAMSGPSTASFVEAEAESEVSSRIASPAKATNIEAESDSHAGPSSPLPRSNTATRKLKNRQTTVWTSGDNAHFRAGFENPQEWDANIADLGRMGAIETAREREAERREALKLDAEKIEALKLAKEKNRAMTERALTGELETIVEQSDDDSFNTVIAQSQRSVSRESTLSAASTGGRPTMTGSATVVDLRSAAAAAGGDFDAASKEAFDDEATQVDRSLGPAQGLGDKKA